ncbi:peptidylprolyl isomerase [uncultured Algibacter sp.]|uniref:peptidylprolyl isomerase n=1 Tax=uncultured Algibacter sp. TaxID=298659 RepID=UPI002637579C|nr:peptidylprolyl isomerase [uncultured Algibacter sp.]
MHKQLLTLLFIGITTILTAQTSTEAELQILKTPKQIENYLEIKNSKKNKLITFNEEKHKTILAKDLFKLHVGATKVNEGEFEKTFYKVINKSKNTYHRVAYIYLDASKYSIPEINNLREKIIAQYNNGASFDFLAKQYSMDSNANKGGDLGWFLKGDMHSDFENEVLNENHSLNDIFTIDIPSEKWYYVVLKTHEAKEISEIDVLKIVEAKE